MARPDGVSELEQLALLAVARLGEDGYGVTVRREIEERAGHGVSVAAVYAALDRLEARGLLESRQSAPSPQRGGRARRHFRITAKGRAAVLEARDRMARMWHGLDLEGEVAS